MSQPIEGAHRSWEKEGREYLLKETIDKMGPKRGAGIRLVKKCRARRNAPGKANSTRKD